MTRLTIYGDRRSGNCLKVSWTADLLGTDYDWVDVDVKSGETRSEKFLKLNPAGQVPTLVLPDGRTLAQSNAIIVYLAGLHDSALIPAEPFARAKINEWLFWEQYSHEPFIAVRRFQKLYLGKRDDELDPRLYDNGHRALALMAAQLRVTPFIAGDAVTVADIALVAYTRLAHEGGFDIEEHAPLRDWIGRVERDVRIPPLSEAA